MNGPQGLSDRINLRPPDAGVFNNSVADIKELTSFFEYTFSVELGNVCNNLLKKLEINCARTPQQPVYVESNAS